MVKNIILLKNPGTERPLKFEATPNRGQKFKVSDFFVKPCIYQIKSPEFKNS